MKRFRSGAMWRIAKVLVADPARRVRAQFASMGRVPLQWCLGPNWGDALSPVLVELLSGRPAMHFEGLHHHRYLAIGSILDSANERAEVWGSGFIRETGSVIGRPKSVHAVRGPLSRALLLRRGIECPEVYGDPALLLPRFFDPDVPKRHSVGIIPHYIDKGHPWLDRCRRDPEVLILDIESDIQAFVRSVKSCGVVLSSSLHGLICADSYGIPNAWIQLSDNVVGGDFKFRDYRLSVDGGDAEPLRITEKTKIAFAVAKAESRRLQIDLRRLTLACPFLSQPLRREILSTGTSKLPERFSSVELR